MFPKTLKFFLVLLATILLDGLNLYAQSEPRNSLSLGVATGPVMVAYPSYNTAGMGMDFNYEYRLLPFLSVQAGLSPRYFFPLTLDFNYGYNNNGPSELAHSVVTYKQTHFTFRLAPCFYLRREYFSLFAGISGAVGNYRLSTTKENEYANHPSQGEFLMKTSDNSEIHSTFGFSPFLGLTLAVGGPESDDEMVVSFSFNQHKTNMPVAANIIHVYYAGYRSLEVQTAYRLNF